MSAERPKLLVPRPIKTFTIGDSLEIKRWSFADGTSFTHSVEYLGGVTLAKDEVMIGCEDIPAPEEYYHPQTLEEFYDKCFPNEDDKYFS